MMVLLKWQLKCDVCVYIKKDTHALTNGIKLHKCQLKW